MGGERIQPRGYAKFGKNLGTQLNEFASSIDVGMVQHNLLRVSLGSPRSPVTMSIDGVRVAAEIELRAKKAREHLIAIAKLKKLVRERQNRRNPDIYAVNL